MFIFNFKVNGNKLFKIILLFMIFLAILLLVICCMKIFSKKSFHINDSHYGNEAVTEIDVNSYTNILKAVHDNIDSYVNMKIKFSGYIYKLIDFNDNQFVLARNMVISSNSQDIQTVVVGFLCEYNKANNYESDTWVEIEGTIKKGKYHNSYIPIVKITNCKSIEKPENEFVYPPDNTYVPTINIF